MEEGDQLSARFLVCWKMVLEVNFEIFDNSILMDGKLGFKTVLQDR